MSDREKTAKTPPPLNPDATAPVMRGLDAEAVTAQPDAGESPTLAPSALLGQGMSLVGQTFGDFLLTEELGRGGMGVVFKAIQKSLDRPVALKLLLSEHSSNPLLLKRFLEEARAAARLTHPNIVSVYQVGECFAGPYFVMEFIDGPSLEQLLQRTLPIGWTSVLIITVTEAVQHAHEKGIVHRDLKPGNIMLHESKRPVVMDFGIAKVLGKGAGMTQPGAVMGTPAYMPPEQAGDEPSKIGPHSDVYSLGAILYTLLTGKVPFDEGTAFKTILKVISETPPEPVRNLRPEVPPRLEQICMKCMEKDPIKRYPTAHALAEDLKRFRAGLTSKGSSASIRTSLATVVLVAPGGKQVRLFQPATVIGRHHDCDLVVKASEISKRHCRILIAADQVVVEDLGSSNGTFVNGKQVERARLADSDELDLGGHVFTIRFRAGEAKG
jgi:serine/threonine protein kinase